MVPIPPKHKHPPLLKRARVAIPWVRQFPPDGPEFPIVLVDLADLVVVALLPLLHLVVVHIETLVRILYDK